MSIIWWRELCVQFMKYAANLIHRKAARIYACISICISCYRVITIIHWDNSWTVTLFWRGGWRPLKSLKQAGIEDGCSTGLAEHHQVRYPASGDVCASQTSSSHSKRYSTKYLKRLLYFTLCYTVQYFLMGGGGGGLHFSLQFNLILSFQTQSASTVPKWMMVLTVCAEVWEKIRDEGSMTRNEWSLSGSC